MLQIQPPILSHRGKSIMFERTLAALFDDDHNGYLRPLKPGEYVRVYRTHTASPIYLQDPTTGSTAAVSYDEFEVGVVRDVFNDCYTVTVFYDGRELIAGLSGRHWIRLPNEPAPAGSSRVW